MGGRPQGSPLRRVTRGATGGPMWASAPTDVLQGVRWGGRGRTPPLRTVTRGVTGGRTEVSAPTKAYLAVHRGGVLPLPRATARVAPTEGYKRYSGRVVREADPYGWLQGIQRAGRPGGRPLRRVTRGAAGGSSGRPAPTGGLQEVRGFMSGRRWWGGRSRTYRHPRGGGGCGW